jgi:hypothetical protein
MRLVLKVEVGQPTRLASKLQSVSTAAIIQLRDAVQHTAMPTLQTGLALHKNITPPLSFADYFLTPLLTNEKPFV